MDSLAQHLAVFYVRFEQTLAKRLGEYISKGISKQLRTVTKLS